MCGEEWGGARSGVVGVVVRPRCPFGGDAPFTAVTLAGSGDQRLYLLHHALRVGVALWVVGDGGAVFDVETPHEPAPGFVAET